MVRGDGGQLYTIEGIAAGLIMIITAYMVVNATSVYAAGDTHISDMQLETLGDDALTVMGTPLNATENTIGYSVLRTILEQPDSNNAFKAKFLEIVNTSGTGPRQDIRFVANYTCRDDTNNVIFPLQPISSSDHRLTGSEHPVRVTKWVVATTDCKDETGEAVDARNRAVLVEVLLWRD